MSAALLLIGALISLEPVASALVAVALLLVGVFAQVDLIRLARGTVVTLLVLTPVEQWLGGLPLGPASALFVVMSDALVAMLLVMLPTLVGRIRDEGRMDESLLRASNMFLPALALGVVASLSLLAHPVPLLDAVYWARTHLRFIPLGLVVAVLVIGDPRVVSRFLRVVVASAFVQSIIGIIEYVGGKNAARLFWPGAGSIGDIATTQANTFASVGEQIVAGTLGHYNILGTYLTLAFCIVVGARSLIDDRARRWSALLPLLFALVVMLTQSRQSIAALLVAGAVVMFASGRKTRRPMLRGVLVFAVIGVLAVSLGNPLAEDIAFRFEQLTTERYWQIARQDNRGFVVVEVLPAAISYDPVLGAGPGSFGRSFQAGPPVGEARLHLRPGASRYVGDVGGASIAIQTGLLGLVTVLWLLGLLAWKSGHLLMLGGSSRAIAIFGFGTAATMLVTNVASSPLTYKATSALLWLVVGIVAGRYAVERRRAGESG